MENLEEVQRIPMSFLPLQSKAFPVSTHSKGNPQGLPSVSQQWHTDASKAIVQAPCGRYIFHGFPQVHAIYIHPVIIQSTFITLKAFCPLSSHSSLPTGHPKPLIFLLSHIFSFTSSCGVCYLVCRLSRCISST